MARESLFDAALDDVGLFDPALDSSGAWDSQTIGEDAPVAFTLSLSSNIGASGEATTAQLAAPGVKTTSDFQAGRIQDDENPADSLNLTADKYTELEWSAVATDDAVVEADYEFRVTASGVALDSYDETPQVTIQGADIVALAGTIRCIPRLAAAVLLATLQLTPGKLRAVERVKGVTLTQTQPVRGTVRAVERLPGLTLTVLTSVRGTVRSAPRVRPATLTQTLAITGKVRSVGRLQGVTLSAMLALSGKVRSVERLKGIQFTSSLPLAGTVRALGRLPSSGLYVPLALTGTIRAIARTRPLTLASIVSVQGTVRSVGRMGNLVLDVQLGLALSGTIRALVRVQPVALTALTPLGGVVRSIERVRGALLLQDLALTGGTIRSVAILRGQLSSSFDLVELPSVAVILSQPTELDLDAPDQNDLELVSVATVATVDEPLTRGTRVRSRATRVTIKGNADT